MGIYALRSLREIEASQIYQKTRIASKTSDKRPRAAYREVNAEAARGFGVDAQMCQAVESAIAEFKQVRTSLYRAYNNKYPVVNGINNIPNYQMMSLQGSASTDPNDAKNQEANLIYQQVAPPTLAFACRRDLGVLHISTH